VEDRSDGINHQCTLSKPNDILVRMGNAPMVAKGIERIENRSKMPKFFLSRRHARPMIAVLDVGYEGPYMPA